MAKDDPAYSRLSEWDARIAADYERSLTEETGVSRGDFEAKEAHRLRLEEEAASRRPGVVASLARGAKQGITLDFGDEIAGALESAFTSKTYKQARDEARAKDREAQESSPVAYGLGQILGGGATALVPGAGLAKLGTGAAATIARGAGAGIVAGAGASEAESVEGVVRDAAVGGLVGGAAGAAGAGLSKILGSAPARADRQLLTDVGRGATPKVYREISKKGSAVVDELRETGLESVARKPEALATGAKGVLEETGAGIERELVGGWPRSQVLRALHKVEEKFRTGSAGEEAAADKIAKQIDLLRKRWKGDGPDPQIPVKEINRLKSSLQEGAFSGADLDPRVAIRAQRQAAMALKDVVMEAVKKNAGPEAAERLAKLNRRYSALSPVQKAADYKATRAKMSPTGIRQIAGEASTLMATGMAAASGNPLPLLLTAPALNAVGGLNRAATAAMARLVKAARAGEPTAELFEKALVAGVPRGAALSAISAAAPDRAQPR